MKYMIISDIHGDAGRLEQALERFRAEEAGALILLGDLLYHGPRNPIPAGYDPARCARLLNQYADRIIAVTGNCDADVDQMLLEFPIGAPYMIFPLEGTRVIVSHGHIPPEELYLHPGEVLVHGHTHLLKAEKEGDGYVVNPGSVTFPKEGNPPSYAIWQDRQFLIKTLDGEVVRTLNF